MLQLQNLRNVIVFFLTTINVSSSGNILIFCLPIYSHHIGPLNVGKVLKQQGHVITVAVPPELKDLVLNKGDPDL